MSRIDSSTSITPLPLPAADGDSYRIRTGDTLTQIAEAHGTTVDALLRANPQIHNPDRIYAGDTLHLPAAADTPSGGSSHVHVVQAGDTLSELARSAHVDLAALIRANNISNPNLIHVGDRLVIPGAGSPGAGGGGTKPGPSAPAGGHAGWMDIARGELGQKEIAGAQDNQRIVQYHQTTTLRAKDDETPWCSSFVNWTLEKAGFKGTDSAAAISWKNWGDKVNGLSNGREGDVVVIRNRSTGQEHVGFLDHQGGGQFTLLGGNQSNQVKLSTYSTANYEVVAVRRPPGGSAHAPADTPAAPAAPSGSSKGITEADYQAVARQLGVDVAAIKAVAQVEASGEGMLASGKPKILFEAHVFHSQTNGRFDASNPNISSPNWNKALYGKSGEHQWDRFNQAYALDPQAAMKSASWGRFQIMGFNYRAAGFSNVQDFVKAMKSGEGAQLKAFASFIESNPAMHRALQNHDWAAFARSYNGAGYAQNQYDTKIAQAYARFAH